MNIQHGAEGPRFIHNLKSLVSKFLWPAEPAAVVYVKWWHSFLISFSIVSWGFAQPLYGYVIGNDVFKTAGAKDILGLIFFYQIIPLGLLFLIDRGLGLIGFGSGIFLKFWRVTLYLLATLVFLRNMQLSGHISVLDKADSPAIMGLVLIAVLVAALLVFVYYRWSTALFVYLSAASLVITAVFITDVGLVGRGWNSDVPVATVNGDPFEDMIAEHVGSKQAETSGGKKIGDQSLDPVFLIVFDALGAEVLLKDGQIDAERFPNLAGLGADSAVFDNATSNYIDTGSSMATILSGTHDPGFVFESKEGGIPDVQFVDSMHLAGYLVEFYSTILTCVWPDVICRDRALYSAESPHVAMNDFADWFLPGRANQEVRRVILKAFPATLSNRLLTVTPKHRGDIPLWNAFLGRISGEFSKGRAYVVHSFFSHQPYEWDRDGNLIRTRSVLAGLDRDFEAMASAYEEQVMFLDRQVGEFITKLKEHGLYDEALVIVTGDHGPRKIGLRHTKHTWDYESEYPAELDRMVPWVPLIIKAPEVEPDTYSVEYQHIDLVPTVLDILDAPLNPNIQGVSAFASSRPDRQKTFQTYPAVEGEVLYIYDEDMDKWLREN